MSLDRLHDLEALFAANSPLPPDPDLLLELAALHKTYHPPRAIELAGAVAQSGANDPLRAARALAIRACAECQIEEEAAAMRHANLALTLLESRSDPLTLGYAYLALGMGYVSFTAYDDALDAGLKAYAYLGQAGDVASQANSAFIMIAAYSRLGDRERAEQYGFRAIEQFRALQNPGGEILQLNNLAMHFLWMGDHEQARALSERALDLLRRLLNSNTPFHYSYLAHAFLHTIADIALARNDLAAAEQYLQEGLALSRNHPFLTDSVHGKYLNFALGKLYRRRGQPDKARRLLLHALRQARRSHYLLFIAEVAEELVAFYEEEKEYRKALRYYRYFHALEKSRYREHLIARMHRLATEYEIAAAQREMELLAEKNRHLEQAYAELQRANDTIRDLSRRDGLTRLYTRQYFDEWATPRFEQSRARNAPFALLLCDVDNFKMINDTWLHHIGDRVLQTVAGELAALCPPQGSAARYGGEEFIMAAPDCALAQMAALAETFRRRVEQYPWHTVHPLLSVTVSVGVVDNLAAATLAQQKIQADRCLYEAKRQNKNKVIIAESAPPSNSGNAPD